MEYQLVPMDRSHLSGVAELERLCFSTPWNETMLEEELFNPTASFIVAEGAGGRCWDTPASMWCWMRDILTMWRCVHPAAGRDWRPAAGCVLPLWAGPPGLSDLGGPALQPGGGGPVLQAWLSGGGTAKGLLPRSHRGRPFADPDVRPMTLRDLTLQELHHLHRHELREAFPPEELKPFAAMKKLYRAGVYHPVGAWEGETLVGYALLWEAPQRKYVLIDYLGVTAARRNGGLGAELLRLLREKFRSWDGIIVESEAPEGGQSDGIRQRRMNFYRRNGYTFCGMTVCSSACITGCACAPPTERGARRRPWRPTRRCTAASFPGGPTGGLFRSPGPGCPPPAQGVLGGAEGLPGLEEDEKGREQ